MFFLRSSQRPLNVFLLAAAMAAMAGAGCASLAGLGDLEEVPCPNGLCADSSAQDSRSDVDATDGPADGADSVAEVSDGNVATDAPSDSPADSLADSPADVVDSVTDASDSASDSGSDSGSDTGSDTGADSGGDIGKDATDTGADAGCTLGTALNCGACGQKCDTITSGGASCSAGPPVTCKYTSCVTEYANCNTTAPDLDGCETNIANTTTRCGSCTRGCSSTKVATASCTAGLCDSTCLAGFVNCKTPAAPAADDGCECAGTACCGALSDTCQPKHSNGVGQFYFDCRALGTPGTESTYNGTMANEAAAAWSTAGTIGLGTCGTGVGSSCSSNLTATACGVWCFTGVLAGYQHLSATASCFCPNVTDGTTWN